MTTGFGWHVVVARDGRVVHSSTAGQRDAEAGLPVTDDTRWRIYSMSKPITSVAAPVAASAAAKSAGSVPRW